MPSLGWSHRGTGWLCSRTRRSMSMQHVQYGWLKQCILKCHCALDDLVWISSSLAEPELARATRSLRLQNPSPTSHLPKHEAGVILLSPCKSVLWMMKQKNLARLKEREMPLLFATCREHEEKHRIGGGPSVTSPPCVNTRPVTDPGHSGVSWERTCSSLVKHRPFRSCTTWKGQTLGLAEWPPFASCEAFKRTIKL